MTIKQAYQRARRNYLRRVRNQEKQGYIVGIIPIVKKPTKASIRRLEKQTAKEIQRKADFQSLLTGEIVDKPTRQLIAENKAFMQLSAEFQEVARTIGTTDIGTIEQVIEPEVAPVDSVDVIIQNWYDNLERMTFTGDRKTDSYIFGELTSRTNELLFNASREERARFAYVIDKNPNILGDYKYFNENQFNADFNAIREAMNWAENSEDYINFIEKLGIVERES